MNKYFAWSLVCVPAFLPVAGQTVNPSNQINWPLVTGSGAPTLTCNATNYGQPYTDTTANKDYKCGSAGWFPIGSGGTSSFTSNVGVGANNSSAYSAVNEVNYKTTSGNTAFACEEDQNRGDWDVRCIRGGVSWASNPSQALINTIQAAECYHYVNGGPASMTVHLPAGTYSIGGNISLPPGIDVEGVGGTDYGGLTVLVTNDSTQTMFTQVSSETFTCNGTNYTDNAGVDTLGNVTLNGGGSAHANDVGLVDSSGGSSRAYIHNIGFTGFGGPGRSLTGGAQASSGSYIYAASNLQWYYFSGAYNPSGFTDTTYHGSLEIGDLDSNWDHLLVYGQLQDSGYYNRYYLCNVYTNGGRLTDSFIQLAPNLVCDGLGATVLNASNNRLDDGWWYSFSLLAQANIHDNQISGYCTSPTLNPTNFPSNPGGVSTDPNCSAINFANQGSMGGIVARNNIVEDTGLWAAWPVWAIYFPGNISGQVPTIVDQPLNTLQFQTLGGALGYNNFANPGADVGRSMYDATQQVNNSAGGTVNFNYFKHLFLNDTVATSYNNFSGIYPDSYVTIYVSANDTIQNGGAFHTCTGANITGTGLSLWWYNINGLYQQACAGGGGNISGLTASYIPLANGATSLGSNSPLDYGVSTAGVVTSSKPVAVNDGSGLGGQFDGTEGTAPTGVAGQDLLWSDSTAHYLKMNNNNGGAMGVVGIATPGTSGHTVALAANGKDIIDNGPDGSAFTPTKTGDSGLGTGGSTTLQAGSNDNNGWFTFTVGTSPTGAGAGLITITFGGTYPAARQCSIIPYNSLAFTQQATANAATVLPGNSTATNFVVTPANSTAFTASTGPYGYFYRCGK